METTENKVDNKEVQPQNEHEVMLNNLLNELFNEKYETEIAFKFHFDRINKKWLKYVRDVNSTSRTFNIGKKAFKHNVFRVLANSIKK